MSAISKNIGVFDSGFGGLTVLRALLPRIPAAHYFYLGDTARLPYGAKSQATIARYAIESARFLESRGCEFLVIACNTATALALEDIRRAVDVPVLGVIEPGAAATGRIIAGRAQVDPRLSPDPQARIQLKTEPRPDVLVLATAATVQSHAYRAACDGFGLRTSEFACPLLVPLVEEGWIDHDVTRAVLRIYLSEALRPGSPEAVLLGCTHYPLIALTIENVLRELGCHALVIDSAEATASAVSAALAPSLGTAGPHGSSGSRGPATFECFATDSVEKFQRLGSLFLERPIPEVHHLDLGG